MTGPTAPPDRRFHAFVVDRAVAWPLEALAVLAGWWLWAGGSPAVGVTVALVGVLAVVGAFAALLGARGSSPGRALLDLRVVGADDGAPIGVAAALRRSVVLGLATLPTLGLGTASLAWTALADGSGRRRGWHDLRAGSVVVDVRPQPAVVEEAVEAPAPMVNLTAMRLVPATAPAGDAVDVLVEGRRRADRVEPPLPPAEPTRPVDVRRAAPRWRVTADSGESLVVDGPVLVGRRPEPRPGEDVRHLVALASGDMSLSKTHAALHVAADGVLVALDRGSTNGTLLVREGVTRELPVGRPTTLLAGDRVRLGDRLLTVSVDD